MQTFLPYPDFASSMKVLDPSRIGNQVWREGMTILRGGWSKHPCARMWNGYQDALAAYLWAGVQELFHRGSDYRDRLWAKEIQLYDLSTTSMPPWLGNEKLHASHRSNLLRKSPEYYGRFGWSESPDLPYVWPC